MGLKREGVKMWTVFIWLRMLYSNGRLPFPQKARLFVDSKGDCRWCKTLRIAEFLYCAHRPVF
jgi:hypothetical protein